MTDRTVTGRVLAFLVSLHVELALLAFCIIIFFGVGRTDGPVFDVVGPDLLPTVTAGLVGVLVLLQIVRQTISAIRTPPPPIRISGVVLRNAAVFTASTALFVMAVAAGWLPFWAATCIFVTVNTVLLSNRLAWRDVAFGAATGLVLGLVLQFVFTQVLFIDLPS